MSLIDRSPKPTQPSRPEEPADQAHTADGGSFSAKPESPRQRFFRRFRRERVAMVMLGVLAIIAFCSVFANLLTNIDPNTQELRDRLQGPSGANWFGTDDLGRDVFTRTLFAGRVSLLAAIQATAIGVGIGVPIGLMAGYLRGWVDVVASRVADAIMSIPALLLALAIVGVLEPNLTSAMIAIGIVYAPQFFRLTRASTMAVREETFIEAARSVGGTSRSIITGHILPNALSPLVVQISLAMGFAILFEASISFLGLGVQAPDSSWGSMLGRSTKFFEQAPHLVIIPGAMILVTVLAFNVIGDGIRDSLGREIRRPSQ